jgi:putative ABC transport system permease protein
MNIILDIFQQSFILFPLILGIYISYKVLNVTDLTVEGSFVLGAVVFAKLVAELTNPLLAMIASIVSGALSGIIVALVQRHNKIDSLIAGILMIFMLYSINLQIMGVPNLTTYDHVTVNTYFSHLFSHYHEFIFSAFFSAICFILVFILFKTKLGLNLRAYADNYRLLYKLGKNPEKYRLIGLAISNALAAVSGSLTCQIYDFADINMGFGIALTAIGALLIGIQIIKRIFKHNNYSVVIDSLACFLGVFLYYSAITIFLNIGVNPINLKLLIGIILILLLKTMSNKNYNPWKRNY